jgi:hypothetical protein
MTGTTTGGLVYPLATEPVKDGAIRMQYFLEQLDQDPVERVIVASGSQTITNAAWNKAAWATSEYLHPTDGTGFGLNPNGIQPTLAGRYWIEFAFTFPSGMNNCRRGIGVDLTSASLPAKRNIIMTHNFGDTTKDEQQMRIGLTMSLPAGASGQVTGWIWQQSGGSVVLDRDTFALTIRRLRLGQPHA